MVLIIIVITITRVLSLTPDDVKKFSGGNTILMKENVLDYWKTFDPTEGLQIQNLVEHIEPNFNRLIVFDGRIPHAVEEVRGVHDPREGRLVLHGW